MQRESIIVLAVLVTLAVLSPNAPVEEQSEAAVAVAPVSFERELLDATPMAAPAADPCLFLYNHRHEDHNADGDVHVDMTI